MPVSEAEGSQKGLLQNDAFIYHFKGTEADEIKHLACTCTIWRTLVFHLLDIPADTPPKIPADSCYVGGLLDVSPGGQVYSWLGYVAFY